MTPHRSSGPPPPGSVWPRSAGLESPSSKSPAQTRRRHEAHLHTVVAGLDVSGTHPAPTQEQHGHLEARRADLRGCEVRGARLRVSRRRLRADRSMPASPARPPAAFAPATRVARPLPAWLPRRCAAVGGKPSNSHTGTTSRDIPRPSLLNLQLADPDLFGPGIRCGGGPRSWPRPRRCRGVGTRGGCRRVGWRRPGGPRCGSRRGPGGCGGRPAPRGRPSTPRSTTGRSPRTAGGLGGCGRAPLSAGPADAGGR